MNIFVTGATGFIGAILALKLANEGHTVHALYRSKEKAKDIEHENIKLFKGDITNVESLRAAMQGCEQVYHIAASTEIWAKDTSFIYNMNVAATENILQLALELGVKKLVFTSTAGVFGPSINGHQVNENTKRTINYFLEYERTKDLAEEKVREYVEKGLHTVIVNPTRVYGPGPLTKNNGTAIMIKSFSEGKWRIILGNGKSVGNYVYVDDVINGHLLAMEKGKAGERYILGGDNVDYLEFFKTLRKLTGKKHRMFKLPIGVLLTVSHTMMLFAKLFGIKPFITPPLIRKFNYQWNVSSEKASKELGYQPLTFEKGAIKTLEWLESQKNRS
jgi:nucleoside-diphosphate-sugar epimerase